MAQKREIFWFALTVFKNLPGLQDAFSKKGWETFRAYTVEESYEGTRVVRKEVPLVRSLLFVNCPMKELVNFKYQNNDWFMYYKAPTGTDPGPVDDNEMNRMVCQKRSTARAPAGFKRMSISRLSLRTNSRSDLVSYISMKNV